MTREHSASKTLRPLVRLPDATRRLDVVAFANRDHLALFGTAVIQGRREIVSMDLQSLPDGVDIDVFPEKGTIEVRSRMMTVLEQLAETPPEKLAPISTALLRGIPLTEVLAYRQAEVRQRVQIGRVLRAEGFQASIGRGELSSKDEQRLAYLDDALLYVAALAEGCSPAEEIAEARGIAKRTAETRIARTRELGLLTPAEGRRASGELTEAAVRLRAWVDRAHAG